MTYEERRTPSRLEHRFFMFLCRQPMRTLVRKSVYYWLLDRAYRIPLGQQGYRPLTYHEDS